MDIRLRGQGKVLSGRGGGEGGLMIWWFGEYDTDDEILNECFPRIEN